VIQELQAADDQNEWIVRFSGTVGLSATSHGPFGDYGVVNTVTQKKE
jgi:hypothetical protein